MGGEPHVRPHMAYCVGMENFVKIARKGLEAEGVAAAAAWGKEEGEEGGTSGGSSAQQGQAGQQQQGEQGARRDYAVEAVMTGLDNVTSVFVQKLSIEAQRFEMEGDTLVWLAMMNGTNQCEDCASIGILPVPEGTRRVKVDVVLKDGTEAGLLYVAALVSP